MKVDVAGMMNICVNIYSKIIHYFADAIVALGGADRVKDFGVCHAC